MEKKENPEISKGYGPGKGRAPSEAPRAPARDVKIMGKLLDGVFMATAIITVFLTAYLYFSPSARASYRFLLGPLLHIPLIAWPFRALLFVSYFVAAAMIIMPFDVRAENASVNIGWKDLIFILMLGTLPWLDPLLLSMVQGVFNLMELDRVSVLFFGGGIAMAIAMTARGMATSTRAAVGIICVAFASWAMFYAGLWLSGSLGGWFQIGLWHAELAAMAFSGFNYIQGMADKMALGPEQESLLLGADPEENSPDL